MSTLSAILSKNPEPLRAKTPGIPHEFERIVARCLRKDPDRRFQQMTEVKLALEDFREEWESGSSAQTPAMVERKFIPRFLMAASLAILLATAGGWLWWRGGRSPSCGPAHMVRVTSD
jgi:hypothetical protein